MSNKTLYSFDIFDTLITRATATPRGVFMIMQKKVNTDTQIINALPDILKSNFSEIRTVSEQYVRENKRITEGKNEITLSDIYDYIGYVYNLPSQVVQNLINLEIQLELENVLPIKENIEKLKKIIEAGNKVILISDMYLPRDVIRRLLTKCDSKTFADLKIYVSCEYGVRKCDGKFFELIKNLEDRNDFSNWIHIGDNPIGDVQVPKKYGIITEQYHPVTLNVFENNLLNQNNSNDELQILFGLSKYVRSNNSNIKNKDKYDLGTSFFTPIFYLYVKYIIEDATKNNIKQLFFIARDGYILKQISDLIITEKNLDIKTKYFYGSRKAFRLPLEINYDTFINVVFSEYTDRQTIIFLADKLNIETDVLLKFSELKKDNVLLTNIQQTDLKNKLLQSPEMRQYIIDKNSLKIDLLIKYLKQEINFDESAFFIDSKGHGISIDFLQEIIHSFKPDYNVVSYFFPLGLKADYSLCQKRTPYIFSSGITDIIELFLRHNEGQTLGYQEKGEKIYPILEEINQSILQNWGFDSYIRGILDYTTAVLQYEKINTLSFVNLCLLKAFDFYSNNINDKKIANFIGSIPFSSIGDETKSVEYAPKYNFYNAILGQQSHCHSLSIARSSKVVRKIYKIRNNISKYLPITIKFSRTENVALIKILGIKFSIKSLLWKYRG